MNCGKSNDGQLNTHQLGNEVQTTHSFPMVRLVRLRVLFVPLSLSKLPMRMDRV